jgi:hypothetical protein
MSASRSRRTGILGALALCGTWAFSVQPIEIANESSRLCWVSVESLEKVEIGKGGKLTLTPPSGDAQSELDATLEVDLGEDRTGRWNLRLNFGDTSSVGFAAVYLPPRMACAAQGNVLTIRDRDPEAGGEPGPEAAAEPHAAPGPAAGSPETKAGIGLLPGGPSPAATPAGAVPGSAGSGSAAAAPALAKPDPEAKAKTISMFPHTFTDVEQAYAAGGETGSATVQLPLPYRSVDPGKTRVFFQGEALVIDPKTSEFDAYVTYPLRPCLLGRILDPETRRSLVFHKYAVHDMKSLLPWLAKLAPANPGKLQVTLYTVELSPEQFRGHAQAYAGRTQIQELNAVRTFLVKECKIPNENIERRFYPRSSHVALPDLGQYEDVVLTAGVSRTGEVFHTSIAQHDLFGLGGLPAPSKARVAGNAGQTFRDLPARLRQIMGQQAIKSISDLVKAHYDTDLSRNTYWSRSFCSTEDRLNVPGAALGTLFKLRFVRRPVIFPGDPVKTQFGTQCVACASSVPEPARPAAAAAEAKGPSATPAAKKKAKNKKKAGAATAGSTPAG